MVWVKPIVESQRGYCYISNCTDDPVHTEDKRSLYGAHNFIVVSGKRTFRLFFDYPSKLTFDIGYDREDTLKVSCENADWIFMCSKEKMLMIS